MKMCTDKEKELIELLKGQPDMPNKSEGEKIAELINDIRFGNDSELRGE